MKNLLSVSLFAMMLISCNLQQGNAPQTYQQKVKSVKEIEEESPLQFLKLENTKWDREGIFFIDHYATGTISNTATVAEYKDVTIEVIYQTKTNTAIGRYSNTIYEYFPPHSNKKFSFSIKPPDYCENISLRIVSATAVSNPPKESVNTNQSN